MRIPNWINDSLGLIYILLGLLVMPSWSAYGWQLLHLPVGIGLGYLFYVGGLVGAGDAKFAGAAAPFVAFGDLPLMAIIFTISVLVGYVAHRIAKYSPLRRLAPEWESWDVGLKFPMGLCLGSSLAVYLGLAVTVGS